MANCAWERYTQVYRVMLRIICVLRHIDQLDMLSRTREAELRQFTSNILSQSYLSYARSE